MTNQDDIKKITGRYFQEALKGRIQPRKRKLLKLLIPVAILLFFTFLPLPIPQKIQWTLGIFLFTALMWSFEALPLPVIVNDSNKMKITGSATIVGAPPLKAFVSY
ncbi:MAG: hypothetical protein ACFFCD_08385 [Promethearchaeota archaeon]